MHPWWRISIENVDPLLNNLASTPILDHHPFAIKTLIVDRKSQMLHEAAHIDSI